MAASTDQWTRPDFLALLLHYAAQADLHMAESEREYMRARCGEQHCATAEAYYEQHAEYETIQCLMELRDRFYPGEAGRAELLAQIKGMFEADHHYSHLERGILSGLKLVL